MPSLPELALPEGYAWSLCALHRFFLTWEAPLFDALACADDRLTLAQRGKVSLLSADLAALRLSPLAAPCPMPGNVVASAGPPTRTTYLGYRFANRAALREAQALCHRVDAIGRDSIEREGHLDGACHTDSVVRAWTSGGGERQRGRSAARPGGAHRGAINARGVGVGDRGAACVARRYR